MHNQPEHSNLSMQEAVTLANSAAGQQLLSALSSSHGEEMEQAFAQAAAGNYAQLKATLEKLMASPEAKAMVDRLRG